MNSMEKQPNNNRNFLNKKIVKIWMTSCKCKRRERGTDLFFDYHYQEENRKYATN